jgi:hypothetical protein
MGHFGAARDASRGTSRFLVRNVLATRDADRVVIARRRRACPNVDMATEFKEVTNSSTAARDFGRAAVRRAGATLGRVSGRERHCRDGDARV